VTKAYWESSRCAKEWREFDVPGDSGRRRPIVPVIWEPLEHSPRRLREVNDTLPDVSRDYLRHGLRALLSHSVDERYERVVEELARAVVEAGKEQVPVGAGEGEEVDPAGETDLRDVTVFVATTRTFTDPGELTSYSSTSGELQLLLARVRVPATHTFGEVERRGWRFWSRGEEVEVLAPEVIDPDVFVEAVAERHATDPLVFDVHGVNHSLEDNVRRVGAMAYDMRWSDRMVAFDWPSTSSAAGMARDIEVATASASAFAAVLRRFTSLPRRRALVAHDVGCRAALAALTQFGVSRPVHEVVLVRPEISGDVLGSELLQLSPRVDRITVYVATADLELRAFRAAIGVSNVQKLLSLRIPNIDVIAATAGGSGLTPSLLWPDLRDVVNGVAVAQRMGLVRRERFWELRKS
jgi:hypothetical protein